MDGKIFKSVTFLLVLFILDFDVQRVASVLSEEVQTDKGPVQGIILSTVLNHVKYSAFKGIPYAKPPVESLRFKPPVEIEPWQNTRNCEKEGDICTQKDSLTGLAIGSENCLFLNIYTPVTHFQEYVGELKPVIVWIHGGSFSRGSGNQDLHGPDFLIEADVIVVTLNYRLGAFGFLTLNHPDALGNAGLKDQVFALRWLQKNILNFCGDPNKITLAGESEGGVAVDLHILSDLSKGLFQRSISMSGSSMYYLTFMRPEEAEIQAYNLGSLLSNGQNITNPDALLEILRTASAENIALKTPEVPKILPFLPSFENANIVKEQDKFLIRCHLKKYIIGNYNKHPHMLGFTSEEILGLAPNIAQARWMFIKEQMLSYVQGLEPLSTFISKSIDDVVYQKIPTSAVARIVHIISDILFVTAINLKQQVMSNTTDQPIYYYRNSFDAKNESFHEAVLNNRFLNGTGHTDDVYYIFYSDYMKNFSMNPNSPLSITRNRMVRMWTNFAKYGNPTPNGTSDELLNITWPDSRSTGSRLEISNELSVNNTKPVTEVMATFGKRLSRMLFKLNDCHGT